METEYTGSKLRAALLEAAQLPLPTLLFRLKWEAVKRLGGHRHRYEPSPLTNEDVLGFFPLRDRSPAGLLEYFRSRANVGFLFRRDELPEIRRVWRQRLPAAREKLLSEAERVCRHEFSFLGLPPHTFSGGIDWHYEPGSGGSWPARHWSTIDIRSDARLGDIKQTWSLNRTQFFVTLGRAFVLLEDERYAAELCNQLRSWLAQNPSEIGVNWYSNMECALRCVAWLFALEMTLDWSGWDPNLFADVVRCLIDHHHHMFKDLVYSEYCSVNNHLIGDALGIALLSFYLPELPHAAAYKDRALTILLREGPLHILEDGVHREQAVSYHRFVFCMYLLLGLLMEKNGAALPAALWTRLEGMCEFIMRMRTPTKAICQVGDWDSGRTVVLDDSDIDEFTSMFCTGAVCFRRSDLKAAAAEFREEALWLLGPEAAETFDTLEPVPAPVLDKPHYSGGYYTWRSGWTKEAELVLFKCAPFGTHTHADNLTVLYSARGKDWLVDRGTFAYNDAWAWRTYFRGTRAHNAVVVDGLGQALAHRVFRWLKPPTQRLHAYHSNEQFGYAAGSTNGFRHLPSPVRHARSLLLVKGQYLLILDALHGTSRHEYELLWHIAPGHRVAVDARGVARTRDDAGANLLIQAVASCDLTASVAVGETDPIQGWHSRFYGHKEPAPTVIYKAVAATPIFLVTLIATIGPDVVPTWSLRFDGDRRTWDDRVLVRVHGPAGDDRICLPNPDTMSAGRVRTDVLWLERGGRKMPIT